MSERREGILLRQRILDAMLAHFVEHLTWPTNRELGAALGSPGKPKSTGHLAYHLGCLAAQGAVVRIANARAYRPADRLLPPGFRERLRALLGQAEVDAA